MVNVDAEVLKKIKIRHHPKGQNPKITMGLWSTVRKIEKQRMKK